LSCIKEEAFTPSSPSHQQVFWRRCRGGKKTSARGVSHAHPLLYFKFCLYFIFTCIVLSKIQKKLVSFIVGISLFLFIMLFPKYILEDPSVGSGSIIGKSNIEEFFNHISMHKDIEEKSLAELAPSIEVASAYLIHMLSHPKILDVKNK
jgi:hypothetical protein